MKMCVFCLIVVSHVDNARKVGVGAIAEDGLANRCVEGHEGCYESRC